MTKWIGYFYALMSLSSRLKGLLRHKSLVSSYKWCNLTCFNLNHFNSRCFNHYKMAMTAWTVSLKGHKMCVKVSVNMQKCLHNVSCQHKKKNNALQWQHFSRSALKTETVKSKPTATFTTKMANPELQRKTKNYPQQINLRSPQLKVAHSSEFHHTITQVIATYEINRKISHTTQIDAYPLGGKASLKYVLRHTFHLYKRKQRLKVKGKTIKHKRKCLSITYPLIIKRAMNSVQELLPQICSWSNKGVQADSNEPEYKI